MEELGAYFKSLLDNNTDNTYCNPPVTSFVPILDEPMVKSEIAPALNMLKKNKAPGIDGIPSLVFKLFNDKLNVYNGSI